MPQPGRDEGWSIRFDPLWERRSRTADKELRPHFRVRLSLSQDDERGRLSLRAPGNCLDQAGGTEPRSAAVGPRTLASATGRSRSRERAYLLTRLSISRCTCRLCPSNPASTSLCLCSSWCGGRGRRRCLSQMGRDWRRRGRLCCRVGGGPPGPDAIPGGRVWAVVVPRRMSTASCSGQRFSSTTPTTSRRDGDPPSPPILPGRNPPHS